MEVYRTGHGLYRAQYHIVWIPKYRRRILNPGVSAYLRKLFPKVIRQMPGVILVEQNIRIDHIHSIMIIPPKYSQAAVIGQIKQFSASKLRKKFPWLHQVYWKEQVVWSPGYFLSTIGLDETMILNYVRWQEEQDSGQAKLDI